MEELLQGVGGRPVSQCLALWKWKAINYVTITCIEWSCIRFRESHQLCLNMGTKSQAVGALAIFA